MLLFSSLPAWLLEIDRYGLLGADTDTSAIHGPITDISKIFKSCFLLIKNIIYSGPYPFCKIFKIQEL